MISTNKQVRPKVALSGIEYLCVAMLTDPGQSQRHYLRRLHLYTRGYEDPHGGGTNAGYFKNPRYMNVLFENVQKEVTYERISYWSTKSKRVPCFSKMELTPQGRERALKALEKIRPWITVVNDVEF